MKTSVTFTKDRCEKRRMLVESLMADPICRNNVFEKEGIYDMMDFMILDIGCGTGYFTSKFKETVGLDVSKENIRAAKQQLPNREFVLGDARYLPFRSGCTKGVVFMELIEHMKNPVEALEEIHRCLVCGGNLLLTYDVYCLFHPLLQILERVVMLVIPSETFPHVLTTLSDERDWGVTDRKKLSRVLRRFFVITKEKVIEGILVSTLNTVMSIIEKLLRPRGLIVPVRHGAQDMGSQYSRLNSPTTRFYTKCLMPLVVKITQRDPLGRFGRCVVIVAKKRPKLRSDKNWD